MKSTEIKTNVQNLIDKLSIEEFIYDLLIAYGISKTSVTRLKKGDYNFSKPNTRNLKSNLFRILKIVKTPTFICWSFFLC
jgi:hypothetical protein